MTINTGTIELFCASGAGGGVTARIFYDPTVGVDPDGTVHPEQQPVIEQGSGPNRAALQVDNTTGATCPVVVTGPTGSDTFDVAPGTTRVRLSQLQNRGIQTRADVLGFTLAAG